MTDKLLRWKLRVSRQRVTDGHPLYVEKVVVRRFVEGPTFLMEVRKEAKVNENPIPKDFPND